MRRIKARKGHFPPTKKGGPMKDGWDHPLVDSWQSFWVKKGRKPFFTLILLLLVIEKWEIIVGISWQLGQTSKAAHHGLMLPRYRCGWVLVESMTNTWKCSLFAKPLRDNELGRLCGTLTKFAAYAQDTARLLEEGLEATVQKRNYPGLAYEAHEKWRSKKWVQMVTTYFAGHTHPPPFTCQKSCHIGGKADKIRP